MLIARTGTEEAPDTQAWRLVVNLAAVIFALRTAWHVWSIRPDYERLVLRDNLPPVYALVIFGAALLPIFSSYVATVTLWLHRRWAPRAIVNYAVAVDVSRIAVRFYFMRNRGLPLFSGNEWAFMVSLIIVAIAVAVVIDRALDHLPPAPAILGVPVPRWENWLTIAAAVPALIFAGSMVIDGGSVDDGGDALSRLAWLWAPVALLLIKRTLDGMMLLRPAPRAVLASNDADDTLKPGTYVTPRALGEFFATRSLVRMLDGSDAMIRTLRTRGLAPPKAPAEYDVELLLYGVFIHDMALADNGTPLSDEARRDLRVAARDVANSILADSQRPTHTPEAWDQLVDRRFTDYSRDAQLALSDSKNKEQHLTSLCAKVVRFATKSHVTNPRATKVLLETFSPELERARESVTQCVLVRDG